MAEPLHLEHIKRAPTTSELAERMACLESDIAELRARVGRLDAALHLVQRLAEGEAYDAAALIG